MRTLFSRFLRVLGRRDRDPDSDAPEFSARSHCNACGRSRWGTMRLSSRGSGLAAFRCSVEGPGQNHVTIFAVQRKFERGVRYTFRALSHREHLELGAKVRVEHLKAQARAKARSTVAEVPDARAIAALAPGRP